MRLLISSVICLSLVACTRKEQKATPPVQAPKQTGRADVVTGDRIKAEVKEGGGVKRSLSFTILKSWKNQQPTTSAPFFEPGGHWTVMQAKTEPGDCEFIAGVRLQKHTGPVGIGQAFIAAPSREAGTCLVKALASTLSAMPPRPNPASMGVVFSSSSWP